MPPVVAPEGDLVFMVKAKLPFNFIALLSFTLCCQLGRWACNLEQKTWKSLLRVEAT
jgi:hypothetical protein